MCVDVFRFSFDSEVPVEDAELTLHLASFAAEGLFGAARVRLDFRYHVDAERQAILVDGTKDVGATVVRVFVGLLSREFGDESFRIERVVEQPRKLEEAVA